MKKLLFCMLLGAAAFGAKATHLMGGDLIVTNVGPNQFEVRLTEYRDTLGIPLYTQETVDIYSYDATTNAYTLDTSLQIAHNVALSTSLIPSFPYGVEIGVYNDTITLPAGQYRMVMSSCCRNAAIMNMAFPGGESMLLYTDFTVDATGGNNSPNFLATPVAYFPVNDTVVFNPLPFDPDGDSLVWSLNIPFTSGVSGATGFDTVAGFTAPSADPAGPFTMNPVNGEITWIPNTVGNWVQSFVIDEYRNGVKIGSVIRDFQYVIVPPDSNNLNSPNFVISNQSVLYDATQNYNWMWYYSNEPLTFTIEGSDVDANATLELNGYADIFQLQNNPATFTTNGTASNISGVLNWTPSATYNKDVILVFRLKDGWRTKDYTLLLRRNQWPSGINNVNNGLNDMRVYPNPANTQINVSLNLEKEMNGEISLYSAIGQKVATFQNGKLAKGNHQINQNINLASGMYYLVVRDGSKIIKSVPVAVK